MARARSVVLPCIAVVMAAALVLSSLPGAFVPAAGSSARAPAAAAVVVAPLLLGAMPAFAESDPETSFSL
eukprot:CAMPEP_0177468548 /NCGR_PEP_ID=MMETSP0369-20130122/19137_1 /TAXON_ID=447022 ORGANISM="Scrippsiella hangoei-like, Strain SHHI-4" /NCGR_SAMPLE_ID=MMETSP0369 /ASSEMBLY_ACC=CAM_ASM_000364 /LENGTH=69 /DNA_ID=CAMNT_0018942769 /DNA_START=1 /DNA_END=207 /DNA_ORIENTATION=+